MKQINCKRVNEELKKNIFLICVLISLAVGFAIGIILKRTNLSDSINNWFKLPGLLFIRCLELLILPVIFVGVLSATASLSAKNNVRITLYCVFLIVLTHFLAVMTGLGGSLILRSILINKNSTITNQMQLSSNLSNKKTAYDIISDILRNFMPKNIIKSTTHQEITQIDLNGNKSVQYIEGTNLLGILFFAILIGLATSVLETKGLLFKEFFKSANEIMIKCLSWIIICSPVGIASLIIEAVVDEDNVEEGFKKIGLFAAICSAALFFYAIFILAGLVLITMKQNPFKYFLHFLEPALLAAASTSGAVCMHKSLEICEQKLKMDQRISRFTIPFYTALQADGSAIFIVMSTCFLANSSGLEMNATDYAVVLVETAILCMCLPSVPSSSIVTILVVLNTINMGHLNIALLYTVEWLLDRIRTTVNLYSHDFCAVITHHLFHRANSTISNQHELEMNETNDSIQTFKF